MLEAEWNEAYVQRRYRVGDVHAHVGISPQVFLGAYNQYFQFCMKQLAPQLGGADPGSTSSRCGRCKRRSSSTSA